MKSFALAVLIGCASLTSINGVAADSPHKTKMETCNTEAGDRQGEARGKFVKECMSGTRVAGKTTQQERMSACNARATGKKGDERKTFMSECLRG
jgi:psiF repeat